MGEVAGIHAQRAEVEALLAFRHTPEGEARILAWWRLQAARRARLALLDEAAAAHLAPLPPPPPGALTRLQAWGLRLGWLRIERATPPAPIARRLPAA